MKHKLLNKLAALAALVCIIGTQPLSADTVTYIITDPAGSPIAGMNQAGAITWRENYQPFGEKLENSSASTDNDIWFGGKEYDDDTELSFFGARYYEPTIGRFVSIDPQGFDEENIFSFGRYAYGNNNPYKFVDPDGRAAILYPIAVFVGKELAAEGASQATGGATDFLSVRRAGTKAAKYISRKAAKGGKSGSGTDFVVTSKGDAVPVPDGATGPRPTVNKGGNEVGFEYTGGSGGKGMNSRVDGTRVMDANEHQGRRAVYMNEERQTVNKATGRTVSNSDTQAHHYLEE